MEIETAAAALMWLSSTPVTRAIIVAYLTVCATDGKEFVVVAWIVTVRGDLKPAGTYKGLLYGIWKCSWQWYDA